VLQHRDPGPDRPKEAAVTSVGAPYPEPLKSGDRVILTAIPAGYPAAFRIEPGMTGIVDLVDSQQTVHVRWADGQRFGIIAPARHLLRRADS
jgi:hypothetical protein